MEKLIVTDLRTHPGDSAFLVDLGEKTLLYDSGFAFTGNALVSKVEAYLEGRPLDMIFLTHSHYDHALGSAYVKRRYPLAKVVAGAYAAGIFAKPSAKKVMRELDQKVAKNCGVFDYEDLIDSLAIDIPVKDGDVITVGERHFHVVDLPGHTRCSIGFYCPEEKLLLSSETIGVYNGEDDVVPSYLVGYAMSMRSIEKVVGLDIQKLLIPHYGLIEGDEAAFFLRQAKKSAEETKNEIVSMLKQGCEKDVIFAYFKEKYYKGYIETIYPIDAMELNTGIMIELLRREFVL